MKDFRRPPLRPQVKGRRLVIFDLEPVVAKLLDDEDAPNRAAAVRAIATVSRRLFPHLRIYDDGLGLRLSGMPWQVIQGGKDG